MPRDWNWALTPCALMAAGLVLLSASLTGAPASKPERVSAWLDRAIVIDGADDDWKGLTLPAKQSHVALGFVNDRDWLYVCLLATHKQTRDQIAATGLTVWLDGETGRKNAFGIRFPSVRAMPVRGAAQSDERAKMPDQIDVLGPGRNKVQTVPLAQAGGIQVRAAVHPDVFVYELKVPLTRSADHVYAVGVGPGQVVRATFETPEYRGPYPQAGYVPGRAIGVAMGGGRTAVTVNGIPMGVDAALQRPLSVQTTVLLAAR